MANVAETSTWTTGVYQLETTDPVQGGAAGIANQQAKDLASRTKWLKDKLAAVAVEANITEVLITSTQTWTAPAGVDQILILEAVAAGGGGAGSWKNAAGSITIPGGGGGEGARVEGLLLSVTPSTGYTVTVGAAGAGGTALQSDTYAGTVLGAAGSNLTFGALLTLVGGSGGGVSSPNSMGSALQGVSVGGDGGTCSHGGVTYKGKRGGHATGIAGAGGDGGGQCGGKGGIGGASMPSATAGTLGGGGGGDADGDGGAGGAGFVRFCYITNAVTGNT